jgi:hypothetical protein
MAAAADAEAAVAAHIDGRLPRALPLAPLARGGTVILTETDSNHSKISVQFPKEWQPMAVNDSVE